MQWGQVWLLMRFGPGSRIIEIAVIHFSKRARGVAVLFEQLREGHHLRQCRPEMREHVIDPGRIRTPAGEDARARRSALRILAVGLKKNRPSLREPVEMRSLHVGSSVGTQFKAHVVGGDEQDIKSSGLHRGDEAEIQQQHQANPESDRPGKNGVQQQGHRMSFRHRTLSLNSPSPTPPPNRDKENTVCPTRLRFRTPYRRDQGTYRCWRASPRAADADRAAAPSR